MTSEVTKPMGPERYVRSTVRALKVYDLDLTPCRHKLDQNEVPYDLPPAQKRRVAERFAASRWAHYPDFHADEVRHLLAQRHNWKVDGVLVGNGSNELLGVTLEALVEPGGEVLVHSPSFGLYKMFVERAGGEPCFVQSADDLRLPIAGLMAEVERDASRPVILCTPNNPTGDALSPEAVGTLLERLDAPLLLDNAYGEFCEYDYRPLLKIHSNLLLFRTFSKAWSLGGLRLGYVLGDPRLIRQLMKVKLPYNVGKGHVAAAVEVLQRPGAAERRTRAILGRRPQWQRMLERHGFEVLPSQANFFLVRVGTKVAEVRRGLEERSIRVRDVSHYPGLAGCMRISVGSGRALRDVDAALSEIGLEKQLDVTPTTNPMSAANPDSAEETLHA